MEIFAQGVFCPGRKYYPALDGRKRAFIMLLPGVSLYDYLSLLLIDLYTLIVYIVITAYYYFLVR